MTSTEAIMCLQLGLIYGVVAIGIYLTFRTIDFPDLTCDGSFVLGAAMSAVLIKHGYNPYFALMCSVVAGSLAGVLTGILHTSFKITNLLSGILVAYMLYSINLDVMGGVPNIALIKNVTIFTHMNPLVMLLFICGLVSAVISYVLSTDFGLALQSIGQNKRMAMNGGIRIDHMTVIGLALSNGLIGLGGGLFCQHEGFSDITQGLGTVIVGLAGVMIGEKLLPFRSPIAVILSCLFGSIIYRLVVAFALHTEWLGLQTKDLNLITGVMIVCVMLIPMKRKIL